MSAPRTTYHSHALERSGARQSTAQESPARP